MLTNCLYKKSPIMGCTNCNPLWGTFKSLSMNRKLSCVNRYLVILCTLPFLFLVRLFSSYCKIMRFVKEGNVISKFVKTDRTSVYNECVARRRSWCNVNSYFFYEKPYILKRVYICLQEVP